MGRHVALDGDVRMRGALARVHRTRSMLVGTVVARALLLGVAGSLALLALAMLIDFVAPLPRSARSGILPLAIASGVLTVAVLLWRERRITSVRHVARWVEEREPRLEFALVTAIDAKTPPPARARLETAIGRVRWEPAVARRLRTALGAPLAAVAVAGAVLLLGPSGSRARVTAPVAGDVLSSPAGRTGDEIDPLTPIVATVTPPPYARRAAVTVENPAWLTGLAGSSVTMRGRVGRTAPSVVLDSTSITVRTADARWTATLRMPPRPTVVRLRHGAAERIVVLEPVADTAPAVALERPATDTVFESPAGSLDFAAQAHDDIGIAATGIEYIVSSGSGETFSFRSGIVAEASGGDRTNIAVTARVVLDSLKLAAGDIVHFRVFARDGNTISGPSTGYSDTRTVRIARPDERDSVAVDAAPPQEADGSLVSQRMLIILTEALEARRSRMARASVTAESRRIAADQKKLRRSVGDIIFTRLGTEPDAEHVHGPGDVHDAGDLTPAELLRAAEQANRAGSRSDPLDFHGDESPIVAINRPLLEAYNHMWDASRELDIGEPGRALPPMRAALAAIQRARQAERIYLRGRAAPVIVDVAAARLQGKDTGAASNRSPRVALEHRRDVERFTRAVGLLRSEAGAALDSLMLIRVELLAERPAAAAPLGEAIEQLRSGQDATSALARARRALQGGPIARSGLGLWSGGW